MTFIWNSRDGDCLLPSPLDKRSPRNEYVMSTNVDGVYVRFWQDIILYNLHYRDCRATKYQCTVHVACQFYSNEFFCIWWNKGTSDHDSFNLFNKYTGEAEHRGRNCLKALKPNTKSVVFK